MKHKVIIIALGISLLSGCDSQQQTSELTPPKKDADLSTTKPIKPTPNEVFRKYHETAKTFETIEQHYAFYTQAHQQSVISKLEAIDRSSSLTMDQVITTYMKSSKESSDCYELSLRTSTITGDTATLVYDIEDTCNRHEGLTKEVKMVKQDTWKIDDSPIKVAGLLDNTK